MAAQLVYMVSVSRDGFIATEDGDFSSLMGSPEGLRALVERFPETLPAHLHGPLGVDLSTGGRFGTVLMGWNTYAVGLPQGVRSPYPHLRQVVFSRRARELPADVVLSDDPQGVVAELKQTADRDLWLCGGGALAAALSDQIDRVLLKVHDVFLGRGISMFADLPSPLDADVVDVRRFDGGDEHVEMAIRRSV